MKPYARISLSLLSRGTRVQGLSTRAIFRGALVLALATGCAASNFDGQVFRQGNVSFRLAHVPPGWRRIEITDTALAFRDDAGETTVAINGRCGRDAEDVPLKYRDVASTYVRMLLDERKGNG